MGGGEDFLFPSALITTLAGSQMRYSTSPSGSRTIPVCTNDNKNMDFSEWFRGFVDAEGYFTILKNRNSFSFVFGIGLHIDDQHVLGFIKDTLQIGTIYTSSNKAEYVVRRTAEVQKIIEIFNQSPLNSNKQLNFLAFKKGFELFTKAKNRDSDLIVLIEEIRSSINNNRTDFAWINREFNITPGWFLGFVEGDGSFSINLTKVNNNIFLRFKFIIIQTITDLDLLLAIKDFINSLAVSSLGKESVKRLFIPGQEKSNYEVVPNYVSLYLSKPDSKILNGKAKYNLTVQDSDIIKQVLLPYFDRFVFRTKKGLDYVDFKNILLLKDKGFHYTGEGLKLIQSTLKQMNNNRLSTNLQDTPKDRELLLKNINEMLLKPSNLETREDGKIYIKSLNRFYYNNTKTLSVQLLDESKSIVKTWDSLTSCAESLGVSKSGVQKRLQKATRFVYEGKTVYLNKC